MKTKIYFASSTHWDCDEKIAKFLKAHDIQKIENASDCQILYMSRVESNLLFTKSLVLIILKRKIVVINN